MTGRNYCKPSPSRSLNNQSTWKKNFFEHLHSTLLYNASRNVFYNSNLLHIKHYNNCKWNYKKRNPSPSLYLNSSYIFFVIIIHIFLKKTWLPLVRICIIKWTLQLTGISQISISNSQKKMLSVHGTVMRIVRNKRVG